MGIFLQKNTWEIFSGFGLKTENKTKRPFIFKGLQLSGLKFKNPTLSVFIFKNTMLSVFIFKSDEKPKGHLCLKASNFRFSKIKPKRRVVGVYLRSCKQIKHIFGSHEPPKNIYGSQDSNIFGSHDLKKAVIKKIQAS